MQATSGRCFTFAHSAHRVASLPIEHSLTHASYTPPVVPKPSSRRPVGLGISRVMLCKFVSVVHTVHVVGTLPVGQSLSHATHVGPEGSMSFPRSSVGQGVSLPAMYRY